MLVVIVLVVFFIAMVILGARGLFLDIQDWRRRPYDWKEHGDFPDPPVLPMPRRGHQGAPRWYGGDDDS